MSDGIIFYKKINGYVVDRQDILYYYLQMQKLKKEGKWELPIDKN